MNTFFIVSLCVTPFALAVLIADIMRTQGYLCIGDIAIAVFLSVAPGFNMVIALIVGVRLFFGGIPWSKVVWSKR